MFTKTSSNSCGFLMVNGSFDRFKETIIAEPNSRIKAEDKRMSNVHAVAELDRYRARMDMATCDERQQMIRDAKESGRYESVRMNRLPGEKIGLPSIYDRNQESVVIFRSRANADRQGHVTRKRCLDAAADNIWIKENLDRMASATERNMDCPLKRFRGKYWPNLAAVDSPKAFSHKGEEPGERLFRTANHPAYYRPTYSLSLTGQLKEEITQQVRSSGAGRPRGEMHESEKVVEAFAERSVQGNFDINNTAKTRVVKTCETEFVMKEKSENRTATIKALLEGMPNMPLCSLPTNFNSSWNDAITNSSNMSQLQLFCKTFRNSSDCKSMMPPAFLSLKQEYLSKCTETRDKRTTSAVMSNSQLAPYWLTGNSGCSYRKSLSRQYERGTDTSFSNNGRIFEPNVLWRSFPDKRNLDLAKEGRLAQVNRKTTDVEIIKNENQILSRKIESPCIQRSLEFNRKGKEEMLCVTGNVRHRTHNSVPFVEDGFQNHTSQVDSSYCTGKSNYASDFSKHLPEEYTSGANTEPRVMTSQPFSSRRSEVKAIQSPEECTTESRSISPSIVSSIESGNFGSLASIREYCKTSGKQNLVNERVMNGAKEIDRSGVDEVDRAMDLSTGHRRDNNDLRIRSISDEFVSADSKEFNVSPVSDRNTWSPNSESWSIEEANGLSSQDSVGLQQSLSPSGSQSDSGVSSSFRMLESHLPPKKRRVQRYFLSLKNDLL